MAIRRAATPACWEAGLAIIPSMRWTVADIGRSPLEGASGVRRRIKRVESARGVDERRRGERDQFPGLGIEPAGLLTGTAESDVAFHRVRAELRESADAGQNLLAIA